MENCQNWHSKVYQTLLSDQMDHPVHRLPLDQASVGIGLVQEAVADVHGGEGEDGEGDGKGHPDEICVKIIIHLIQKINIQTIKIPKIKIEKINI